MDLRRPAGAMARRSVRPAHGAAGARGRSGQADFGVRRPESRRLTRSEFETRLAGAMLAGEVREGDAAFARWDAAGQGQPEGKAAAPDAANQDGAAPGPREAAE